MNNINNVKREMDDVISFLVQHGLSSFQHYPVIRQCNNNIKKLEWGEISNLSITLKNLEYKTIYSEIDKNKDYTLKFIDGNIIQMMYIFEDNKLASHRLAMFPAPDIEAFQNNPEIYENDEIYADIIAKNIVSFPIRFDYNSENIVSEYSHPNSHVTLGQYKNCRIPVYGPMSPQVFINFILQNFYSCFYAAHLHETFNEKCIKLYTIKEAEKGYMHFNVV